MRIDSSGNTIIGTHNSNAHRLAIESRHATVPYGQLVAGSSDQNQAVGFQFTVRDSDGSERDKMWLINTGLGIGTSTPSNELEIKFDTDKHMIFSDSQGEVGSCPSIHTTNTAGDALVEFGIRASEIRLATVL